MISKRQLYRWEMPLGESVTRKEAGIVIYGDGGDSSSQSSSATLAHVSSPTGVHMPPEPPVEPPEPPVEPPEPPDEPPVEPPVEPPDEESLEVVAPAPPEVADVVDALSPNRFAS